MSWGGHVLYMIQMMRGNGRKRPSLRRGYPNMRERDKDLGLTVNYRKIRNLTDEERSALHKRVALEKRLTSRKSVLALLISALILGGIFIFFAYIKEDVIALYRLTSPAK